METLRLRATLEGHKGWVTCLATNRANPNILLSGSRDKTLIVWDLSNSDQEYGRARKSLPGHNHFVEDVAMTADGNYAISASWDKTLRLWDLEQGVSMQQFVGHKGDVLSVDISPDNRVIMSGSRDRTVKIWNVQGKCLFTVGDQAQGDWVSRVRYLPSATNRLFMSVGWDKVLKVS
jgi:guanine nucleotide-binding protein subunit beta-2-like 1 protein